MRTIKGIVTSTKMDKTIVVSVHTYKSHSKYKKRYRVTKKFYAHDENNTCKENDVVVIEESRPLSKTKRWALVEKLS
jgi:small subunit ribosomal protein S17